MVKRIKTLLAEVACVESKMISNDMHLADDLFLDESEIDDVLNELEDQFGIEFDNRFADIEYVSDIIHLVKDCI